MTNTCAHEWGPWRQYASSAWARKCSLCGAWQNTTGVPIPIPDLSLEEQIAELRTHIEALEAHIVTYGPRAHHSDPSVAGVPQWTAPYEPPAWRREDEDVDA